MRFLSSFLLVFAFANLPHPVWAEDTAVPQAAPQNVPQAVPQPTWSELDAVLGCDIKSPRVEEMISTYGLILRKLSDGDSGSLTPKGYAYSLLLEKDVIRTVFLHVGAWPDYNGYRNFQTYANPLPFGVNKTDKVKQLVARFGRNFSCIGYFWECQDYSLMFLLDRKDDHIESIYLSKRDHQS